ncbi:hypothetical protein NQ314_000718 [Rhamnusium bicolor]|uniref:Uncharacterized protein n=1 Tax=Rhamnusium bicolor TaxID=1586634 RepID=A0AAV8ZWK5_9CUCU|nr:hypothetical protein NQ314_000718 [Rhamnusium bicolor]
MVKYQDSCYDKNLIAAHFMGGINSETSSIEDKPIGKMMHNPSSHVIVKFDGVPCNIIPEAFFFIFISRKLGVEEISIEDLVVLIS